MVDEAHDRTINNDVLLGLLKRIIQKRQDLRLVITSATVSPLSPSSPDERGPLQAFFPRRRVSRSS